MLQWLILNCNQTLQVNFLAYYNNLVSQVRDLMRPWNFWKYFFWTNEVYWWNRSHFWWWVLLKLISTSNQLHKSPPSSLQHPQQYLNQNIAYNWATSSNLGWKTKSYPFWLKIGTHGILEVLIPNPTLDFWNSNPKIWALKFKVVCFVWKMVQIVSQVCGFWIRTLIFEMPTPKPIIGQIFVEKVKVVRFSWKLARMAS